MATPSFSRRDVIKLTALAATSLPLLRSISVAQTSSSVPAASTEDRTRGLKLGVASYTLRAIDVDATIAALRALDIKYISLHRAHIAWGGTPEECRTVAQKFRDAGIELAGTGVINLPNDEAELRKVFENAKAAGLPTMTCKPSLEAFPLVERFVKEYDQRLAIHNHGPEDKVYPTPYEALRAIEKYDSRIGLCVDVGHTARFGADPIEAIKKCAERVYDVHLKDSLALPGVMKDVPIEVGRGRLDIRGILAALIEIKYPHVVGFEYEKGGGNPVIGLAESIGYVRGMLANLS